MPVLIASVAMTLCLGATYSWSLFVDPLKSSLGIGQGTAQIPFTLFFVAFPVTTLFAGRAIAQFGMRGAACLGGLLLGGGWILAGFGALGFPFVAIGIGIIGGVGVGLAYLVPIAAGVQWFPRHKGLVTGVAIAGFGAGSALVAFAGGRMLSVHGATPFAVFRLLGVVYLAVVVLASTQMRLPPGATPAPRKPWNLPRAFRETGFSALYFAMFTGLMAGFLVIANIKQLSTGAQHAQGVAAVALFAFTNAAGRIVWGAASDRIRLDAVLSANLVLQALVLLASPVLLRGDNGLGALALLAGFNYGGVLVLYAAAVANRWGAENVAGLYGQLFSANVPASFAPVAAGYVFDQTASFALPVAVAAATALAGAWVVRKALSAPHARIQGQGQKA